jgi:acyl carrier protein
MTTDTIRTIIAEHGRLSADVTALGPEDDLYAAGLTSHASVSLMLALEDAFDVEFPEELLKRSTFGSIAAIDEAITELSNQAASAG